nr:MAG TPA: minor capsid protein [Caudoviricetes sp.]
MATLDSRTRDSHRQLDGEAAGDDGRFSNGPRYPGDPTGPASEVWNCRCTLVASIPGHDVFGGRDTHGLETSYEDWKAGRDPKRQEPADRTMASFFQMPGTIAKLNASGVSMTEARRSLTEQLGEYGISSGSFRKLSRGDQQKALDAALSRVLGKLRPSAKRPAGEQPVLEQLRYKGPGFMATEKSLAAVNPHFSEGYKWQNNCQRCVVAWELRQRGYDVTAKPFAAHDDIGNSGVACWEFDHRAWFHDSEYRGLTRGGFKRSVESAFDEWGDGARAIVRVKWDRRHGGCGHFFSARREGDKIIYEDPQAGTVRDIDGTLANCTRDSGELWVLRVDDRNLTDLVKEAVTNA